MKSPTIIDEDICEMFLGAEALFHIDDQIIFGRATSLRFEESGKTTILYVKVSSVERKRALNSEIEKIDETELFIQISGNPIHINEGGYNCVHIPHCSGFLDLYLLKPEAHRIWD